MLLPPRSPTLPLPLQVRIQRLRRDLGRRNPAFENLIDANNRAQLAPPVTRLSARTPRMSAPCQLPLTRLLFASALQKGQGRALLHLRSTGLGDLEDLIIDVCLHDRAYDPQCEGNRTSW